MKLFLASPLGFAESTRAFLPTVKSVLTDNGFEVVDPWASSSDLEAEFELANQITNREQYREAVFDTSMRIAGRNAEMLKSCDVVLAVLDGVDVDSGTASEIGYAFGLGKRVFGYRGDFRQSGENDGVLVNLQVHYWIHTSGGKLFTSVEELRTFTG